MEKQGCNYVQDSTGIYNRGTGEFDPYHFSFKRLVKNVPETETPRVQELLNMAVDSWKNKDNGRDYAKELMLIQSKEGIEQDFFKMIRLAAANWKNPDCKIVRETDPIRLLSLSFEKYKECKEDKAKVNFLCDFAAKLLNGKKIWHFKHLPLCELKGDDDDKEFLIAIWKSLTFKKQELPSSHAAFFAAQWGLIGTVHQYSLDSLGEKGWGNFTKMPNSFAETPNVHARPSHAYELCWAVTKRW